MEGRSCCFISNLNIKEGTDNAKLISQLIQQLHQLHDAGYRRIFVGYGNLLERMIAFLVVFLKEYDLDMELVLVLPCLNVQQYMCKADKLRMEYTLPRANKLVWLKIPDRPMEFLDYHYYLLRTNSCCICTMDDKKRETDSLLRFAEKNQIEMIPWNLK